MIILGIETASAVCSVGVVDEEKILGEISLHVPFLHAEWIFPRIDQLLQDLEIQPKDLGGIAVSIGPGSFTGLRVGLSAAKGMAYSLQCPLTAVGTLDALAYQATGIYDQIWGVIPSIRGEIFACRYRNNKNTMIRDGENQIFVPEEFLALIVSGSLIIGIIPSLLNTTIKEHFHSSITVYSWDGLFRGSVIALLGARQINRGEIADIDNIEPMYLRSFPDRNSMRR